MDSAGNIENSNIQAEGNSIAIGGLSVGGSVGGDIRIGHTIGYTSEQVSTLITQISTTFQPKPFDGRSPYKGLDVFEEEDAELFFGREKLVEDLVVRVKESRTVFVTGPSGSGKSSLVRAGLIHTLKQGTIPNSDRWLYATLKPGRDPFEAVAGAFSRLKSPELGDYFLKNASLPEVLHKCAESTLSERSDQRLVLFIDQFEEIFTQIHKDKAQAFVELLAHAAAVENGRVITLFSMRSDFIPNCVIYPKLNAILNRQFVQIGAMQGDELVSAIAQPALRVGLRIEPDLIAQIINDMQGEPGALPLMQFALKDLFDAQQAKGGLIALTLSDYLARGGIRKALERHADNSFTKLNGHERKLTRAIFSSLIEIGRGTVDTRRTAIFDELVPASARSEEVEAIVRKLADARLLTTDEVSGQDTVTISHEKLIDAWPWLRRLVDENRDVIAAQNEIAKDAKEWDDHGRDPSYLYSGARLGVAQEQLAANKVALSGLSKEFLEEGIALREAERKAKEAMRRRIITGLTAGIAIALVLAGFAAYMSIQANRQANIARTGELAAQSVALRQKNFLISLLLGAEAFKHNDNLLTSVQVQSALLDNTQSNPKLEQFLSRHSSSVNSVAFSPGGETLASGSWDNTVILWNMESRQPGGLPLSGHSDVVSSVAFSPDGTTLASGSWDKTIILWDVGKHKPIVQLSGGHLGAVSSVAFSPDGKTLASGSMDTAIVLWDVATHQPKGPPLIGHTGGVTSLAFSSDGKTLASGSWDNTVILWDMATSTPIDQPLTRHTGGVTSLAFSSDGKTLASGSRDNTIILWDMAAHPPIPRQPLTGHTLGVKSIAFGPDDRTLASSSDDATIRLWNVATGEPIDQPLIGHTGGVTSLAFSSDGKTLASGSRDNTIILWDMATYDSILGQPLTGHEAGVTSVAFTPDGKTLASGSDDHNIRLWDLATHEPKGLPLTGHTQGITSVAFSPDGKTLASGSNDTTVMLWDLETGNQRTLTEDMGVTSLAFNPNGEWLATGSVDTNARLWNLKDPSAVPMILRGHENTIYTLAFNPNGEWLATGSEDTTARLWDLKDPSAAPIVLTGHNSSIHSLAFSQDGQLLATGSDDATIRLWDLATHESVALRGHTQGVTSVAFSSDGKTLASGSCEKLDPVSLYFCIRGEIILWDVTTHKAIGQLLTNQLDYVTSVAFSPDGKTLASGSDDTTIMLWDVDPKSWSEKFCQRANRNFSPTESEQYFFGENSQTTCSQFATEPTAVPGESPIVVTIAQATPPPAWPAPPLTPGLRPASYTVQSGEDLLCIARRFNVDISETLIINGLSNTREFYAGLVVKIPQTGSPFPAERAVRNHPSSYTVSSADETLNIIACLFGDVDPVAIAQANNLPINGALSPGQQLDIP